MKKKLFTAMLFCALTASAQVPQAVADRLARDYNEEYTLVSIDTVAMPIRILMSLEFTMISKSSKVGERIAAIQGLSPDLQPIALKKLIENMEKGLSKLVKIEDIVAMRDSNAPHEDDYYNYQRTKVLLKPSGREETFYIRLGEESISRTQVEYNNLEASAFLKYWQYRDLLKKLKDILEMY